MRAATIRMAHGMEPPHFRRVPCSDLLCFLWSPSRDIPGMALEESARTGSKWSQMFRPGHGGGSEKVMDAVSRRGL